MSQAFWEDLLLILTAAVVFNVVFHGGMWLMERKDRRGRNLR